jgi:hypothetical protein
MLWPVLGEHGTQLLRGEPAIWIAVDIIHELAVATLALALAVRDLLAAVRRDVVAIRESPREIADRAAEVPAETPEFEDRTGEAEAVVEAIDGKEAECETHYMLPWLASELWTAASRSKKVSRSLPRKGRSSCTRSSRSRTFVGKEIFVVL